MSLPQIAARLLSGIRHLSVNLRDAPQTPQPAFWENPVPGGCKRGAHGVPRPANRGLAMGLFEITTSPGFSSLSFRSERRDWQKRRGGRPGASGGGTGDPPVLVGDPSTLRSATEDGPTGTEKRVANFKP
jgi:hypothetical protein